MLILYDFQLLVLIVFTFLRFSCFGVVFGHVFMISRFWCRFFSISRITDFQRFEFHVFHDFMISCFRVALFGSLSTGSIRARQTIASATTTCTTTTSTTTMTSTGTTHREQRRRPRNNGTTKKLETERFAEGSMASSKRLTSGAKRSSIPPSTQSTPW